MRTMRLLEVDDSSVMRQTKPVPADVLAHQVGAVPRSPSAATGRDGGSPMLVDQGCRPTVASMLEELLRRRVTVAEVDEAPRRHVARTVGRYIDAGGHDVAACITEIAFAAATTAALSMASPRSAAAWAEAGVFSEAMAQNFYEVAHALTSVVNPGRERSRSSSWPTSSGRPTTTPPRRGSTWK